MNCPFCKVNPSSVEANIRPFCSVRCKQLDLGNWAVERYRIPGEPVNREADGVTTEPDEANSEDSND